MKDHAKANYDEIKRVLDLFRQLNEENKQYVLYMILGANFAAKMNQQ